MLSNVLTAKAISRALLSSYRTRYTKNIYSVATTPLQFRNGMYNFVADLAHLLCKAFANYTCWHNKYELSLTIDIVLLHMYHLSVLPPKQHNIPILVSRQISIANVSPKLTDAQLFELIKRKTLNLSKPTHKERPVYRIVETFIANLLDT